MFDVPDSNIMSVLINEDVVNGQSLPIYQYRNRTATNNSTNSKSGCKNIDNIDNGTTDYQPESIKVS